MAESDFAGLGFAPGVVRGVRSFRVNSDGMLTGIHYQQVWQPGENAAECRRDADAWRLAGGSFAITAKQLSSALQQFTIAASNLSFLADIPQKKPWYQRVADKFWDIVEECVAFIVDDMPEFFRGLYEKFRPAPLPPPGLRYGSITIPNAFPPSSSSYKASILSAYYAQANNPRGIMTVSDLNKMAGQGGWVPISGSAGKTYWAGFSADPSEPKEHSFETCACGFYGYYDGSDDYYREGYVSAVVEGYGETLIGTRGFRAMKARIVALYIPSNVKRPANYNGISVYADWLNAGEIANRRRLESEDLAAKIRENYPGVPVFHTFSAMVAEFPPDKGEA